MKQSPRLLNLPESAADYERSPLDESYETEDKDDDYMPIIDYLRDESEETFQTLNPATREKK